ncbi:MAG: FAD-binding oxidoreductase [Paracoccaceae bacterium]
MALQPVSDEFVAALGARIPAAAFKDVTPAYTTDPRGLVQGRIGLLVAPSSVHEVAEVITAANRARVPVVPYGGGTGLVAGQLMASGPAPVLLSLERMNNVREIHREENVMIAEAGVILQNARDAARAANRLFPLTLASQGSCMIGGNLASNAGGVNVLRYGNARDLCLGLEAVLPNGDIWHGLKRLRKDNTGYDLRNLLIGAEGTLGVITAATLRLFQPPAHEGAALMVVRDPAAALALLEISCRHAGDGVSAFELMHRTGLDFLREIRPDMRLPFAENPLWCVLVDLGLPMGRAPADVLAAIFSEAQTAGLVSDGLVAQSEAQRQDFWALRETIPEANKAIGPVASHDISLPLSQIAGFLDQAAAAIAALGDFRINAFGHLGDGNLHYNVFPARGRTRADDPAPDQTIRRIVYDLVASLGGSFSAEHGIGRMKVHELERYGDPAKLTAMRAIKTALDPNGIMNPGVIFA